ncbi:(R)-mandelonitrile lyase [Cupriavidus pauculus]|nr:cupin domain-containing protein [Cupriavidus pauculus]
MTVIPAGSRAPMPAPAQNFVGTVRLAPMFAGSAPSRLSSGQVTFEAGARSAWHTHPAGQMLVVTAGHGWIQQEGQPKQEIGPGDVVWTPPGVKHWHGATTGGPLTHLAIQESVDGKNVSWLEPVSDDQYRK